jgi:hypothetical protein
VRRIVAAMRRPGPAFALAGDGSEGVCNGANLLHGALIWPRLLAQYAALRCKVDHRQRNHRLLKTILL